MPITSLLPPGGRPSTTAAEVENWIGAYSIDRSSYPLVVVGVRGFFGASTGANSDNERGLYDDAIFLHCAGGGNRFAAFNGNTDPSATRPGTGKAEHKGIAVLNPGAWFAYRFAVHGSRIAPHEALCQRANVVSVTRDGNPPYQDTGWFGINIHRGGRYSTSSEGCQTIPPDQWEEFIGLAQSEARGFFGSSWRDITIPYVLLDHGDAAAPENAAQPTAETGAPMQAGPKGFLSGVIRPTLAKIGLPGSAAEDLLVGTALVESGLKYRTQIGGGPALGLFQMEPATHDDIWQNFLRYRTALARMVGALAGPAHGDGSAPAAQALTHNDAYACAMARVHYLRNKDALPMLGKCGDGSQKAYVETLAAYWKKHYNTAGGAGTPQKFLAAWTAAKLPC